MIKVFFKKDLPTFVGLAVEIVGGFLYQKYVGCTGGTYPVTSSPANNTLRRAVMGELLLNPFKTGSTPKRTD